MDALTPFVNKRGGIKRQLCNLKKFIDGFLFEEANKKKLFNQLKSKYSTIDGIISNYNAVYEKMLNISAHHGEENDVIKIEEDQITFMDNAVDVKFSFEEKLEEMNKLVANQDQDKITNGGQNIEVKPPEMKPNVGNGEIDGENNDLVEKKPLNSENRYNMVKLPKITLPSFEGDLDKWMGFRDSFQDLIIENPMVTNIQRYHYLDGVLRGDARRTIANVEFSSEGFQQAWDALLSKYDDTKAILDNHFRSFFHMRAMAKESKNEISRIVDESQKQLRALERLGEKLSDAVIIFTVKQKFDNETRKLWENEDASNKTPTWNQMLDFLQRRCRALNSQTDNTSKASKSNHHRQSSSFFASNTESSGPSCSLCGESHFISACSKFLAQKPEKRFELVKQFKLCINCFKKNHRVFQCHAPRCKTCNQKHHVLLHMTKTDDAVVERQPLSHSQPSSSAAASTNLLCSKDTSNDEILLSTVLVLIADVNGKYHPCRALLDSASQSCFMSSELAGKLELPRKTTSVAINGLEQIKTDVTELVNIKIKSRFENFSIDVDAYVVARITNKLPSQFIDCSGWLIPPHIKLADSKFNIPKKIDLLLGADVFFKCLRGGHLVIDEKLPVFQETAFGWVVGGRVQQPIQNFFLQTQHEDPIYEAKLDEVIQSFWKIESCENKQIFTADEKKCEEVFKETYRRNDSGRFVVNLPLKSNFISLGDSRTMALKRFHYMENKLERDPELKIQYVKFMKEYESLGHMRICQSTSQNSTVPQYFLPHHAVLKPTSTTTKLRVVFDASAKTSTNVSLNDVLFVGPTVQNDLTSIILQFRKYRYVLTADVEKMYRQILINEEHTPLQKIIWRDDPSEPLREYELLTVTYGTSCAPYLATKTLQQLALDKQSSYPLAAKVILNNFYVDDMLAGSDSIEEAIELQSQLNSVFSEAGMNLRKWSSNTSQLLEPIPLKDRENLEMSNDTIKTLGLVWNAKDDYFKFVVSDIDNEDLTTKRSLLSNIAKLFDPLGLVSPIIVSAKVLMQNVWLSKIGWDDVLPNELQSTWDLFRQQLPSINTIQIPRLLSLNSSSIYIHGFADASNIAYGACVYARSVSSNGEIMVRLISSKSRVSPLNTTSIPRLELNAALLLANLVKKVIKSLEIDDSKCFLWSDSSIVLSWIRMSPHQLKTYVANRVCEIQESTSRMSWRHVDSKNNVADILSRGLMPSEILNCSMWFEGPQFLKQPEESWPNKFIAQSTVPEIKENLSTLVAVKQTKFENVIDFERYSSFLKIVRIVAWCRRFFYNYTSNKPSIRNDETLQVDEIAEAQNCVFKMVQNELFYDELNKLSSNEKLQSKNSMIRLTPFVDFDGLIRVGGRLKNCDSLNFDQRHQILLANHHITTLLIRQIHQKNLHSGNQQTLATLRQNFWIINGKRLVKTIINDCMPCAKVHPKTLNQLMGQLPPERVESCRPFLVTGLDFCGPFSVRYKNQRKETYTKVYICIFVCMTTKAVHLEVVEDATSDAFIACLKRFFSRRGKSAVLWSDNGSNFIGAHNKLEQLKEMFDKENEKVIHFCSNESIQWKFIPPRSPHFGGIWESGVKVIKTHLKKIVGDRIMTLEFLYTLVTQIEGVMNSRPLVELSSDPNDLQPLTPGHFLIGCAINFIPEPSLRQLPMNRLTQWQQITKLLQYFWDRFRLEYVNTLQQRSKWLQQQQNVKINELVLVKDDSLPTTHWLTGRIIETIKGTDGLVRCVVIRTKNGNIKRSVTNIARLPATNE